MAAFTGSMISVPAGSFMMGYDYRPETGDGDPLNVYRASEQPVRRVTLSGFMMSATPVTQKQYSDITGENPSTFRGGDMPVTNLGADAALAFCNMLSEAEDLAPCFDVTTGACDFTRNGYRLPTEAEWEYACRAGTRTHFHTGNTIGDLDRAGWYNGNSGGTLHPVAGREPNAWGLYDMHGNVWEFCYDGWDEASQTMAYEPGPVKDPHGFEESFNLRITRGGGWFSEPAECRSASRGTFWTGGGNYYIGFRLARKA